MSFISQVVQNDDEYHEDLAHPGSGLIFSIDTSLPRVSMKTNGKISWG
jgi:hypothetical protein